MLSVHTPFVLRSLCRVCKQTEANQIAQPLRRLKPQKGLSSYSPSPEAGNRRHATTGQVKAVTGWQRGEKGLVEKLKTETKNWISENRKLWPRPCARLSGQLQIYNTIFHVAATNLCGPLPTHCTTSPPPSPSSYAPWAAVGQQHHLRHVSGFWVAVQHPFHSSCVPFFFFLDGLCH